MTLNPASSNQKAHLHLEKGQRVRVVGGPRKGQAGRILDITDCMYELSIDDGKVGHVWKQNVEAEYKVKRSESSIMLTEEESSLHYRLAKAIQNLKEATAEVDAAHSALDHLISSKQTKPDLKYTKRG